KSLILLDEIGRGTSTFDGISIAWATAEFIHRNIKAKTLFATHYHELTELSLLFDGIKNYNALVREWDDEIIFIRRIVGGISDKSYGIQVARLAGLPHSVIARAKEILENLEKGEFDESGEPRIGHSEDIKREEHPPQLSLFGDKTDLVAKEILNLNIQNMTPLEALNKLSELKKMLGG
ncbi:MAG: DNA mismatch repair protein MutS, partial [Nitrospirota bacterium]